MSAILDRNLDESEPIPSTRKMAKSLGVSRNTVVLAYQGLLDDGYLVARERSGYFVSEKALTEAVPAPRKGILKSAPETETRSQADWQKRFKLRPAANAFPSKPSDWQKYPYPFISI